MDRLTKDNRSKNMSHIHGTETSLEIIVRKKLFKEGFRYRKNVKELPGKPDIVLKKYKTVIFINGCFWHRHKNCKYATIPKTNTDFWKKKLERNAENDKKHIKELRKMGYHVIIIWGCRIKKDFNKEMNRVCRLLTKNGEIENDS